MLMKNPFQQVLHYFSMSSLDDMHGYRVKVALEVGGLAMIASGVVATISAHGRLPGWSLANSFRV
ncbi:MAG: hypothetical protein Q8Q76_02620 [Methylotenera sp.]|nr:hypothetical protein [Methylotenera sp.]